MGRGRPVMSGCGGGLLMAPGTGSWLWRRPTTTAGRWSGRSAWTLRWCGPTSMRRGPGKRGHQCRAGGSGDRGGGAGPLPGRAGHKDPPGGGWRGRPLSVLLAGGQAGDNPQLLTLLTRSPCTTVVLAGRGNAQTCCWPTRATRMSPLRFSQRKSSPGVVEDEGSFGDGADAVGAEGDVLERAPAFFQLGRSPFAQCPRSAQERVAGMSVGVKPQVGAAAWFLEGMVDADAGTLVAGIGEGGQAIGGRLVQRGQAVLAGGGDVRHGARLRAGHP